MCFLLIDIQLLTGEKRTGVNELREDADVNRDEYRC